jgi:hypothetical protein
MSNETGYGRQLRELHLEHNDRMASMRGERDQARAERDACIAMLIEHHNIVSGDHWESVRRMVLSRVAQRVALAPKGVAS